MLNKLVNVITLYHIDYNILHYSVLYKRYSGTIAYINASQYTYTHEHTHTHTYIHTYIHTHTHTEDQNVHLRAREEQKIRRKAER